MRRSRPAEASAARARRRSALAAVGLALLAAACAAPRPEAPPAAPDPARADAPFAVDGRLSARRGGDAVAVGFAWRHAPPRDELVLSSLLGQAVAELAGDVDAGRVELSTSDGGRTEAADWTTLTQQVLGFPLPVTGLAAWIRGRPHRGSAFAVEPDADGRAAVLRQDGWEIVYAYADAAARAPTRLRLSYPDLEIRVVIDRWR